MNCHGEQGSGYGAEWKLFASAVAIEICVLNLKVDEELHAAQFLFGGTICSAGTLGARRALWATYGEMRGCALLVSCGHPLAIVRTAMLLLSDAVSWNEGHVVELMRGLERQVAARKTRFSVGEVFQGQLNYPGLEVAMRLTQPRPTRSLERLDTWIRSDALGEKWPPFLLVTRQQSSTVARLE